MVHDVFVVAEVVDTGRPERCEPRKFSLGDVGGSGRGSCTVDDAGSRTWTLNDGQVSE